MERQKIKIEDQIKAANVIIEIIYDKVQKVSGFFKADEPYRPMKNYSKHSIGEEIWQNISSIDVTVQFESPFTFDKYKIMMDEIEESLIELKSLHPTFKIKNSLGDFVKIEIEIDDFYHKMLDSNYLQNLVRLNKYNI